MDHVFFWRAHQHLAQPTLRHRLARNHNRPKLVEAAPPSAPRHLNVLTSGHLAEAVAVLTGRA